MSYYESFKKCLCDLCDECYNSFNSKLKLDDKQLAEVSKENFLKIFNDLD
jgi:hypothetical protein